MTSGVLPLESLKMQVNLNTGFFETSTYTEDAQMGTTSGNHDKAGMSGGNLQYNFGDADRLQELFLYMINNYPTVVATAFGTNTTQHDEFVNVITTYTRLDRIAWGDSISIPDANPDLDKRKLYEPWKSCFANLLVTPECKAKYYAMRDLYYWNTSFDLFRQMPCVSRMAMASMFDVYVNKGRFYPINLLQVDFERIDADTTIDETEKERQKIYQINQRCNEEENALNDTSSAAFAPRRNAMRDQGGDYFGALYDPDVQFDMNQEPAIAEKAPSTGVNLGSIDVDNVFLGLTPITSIYLGAVLLGGTITPYTTSKVPQTQIRTNPGNYAGIGAATSITLTAGQPIWIDVQNFVACKTYYTIDGSTPTVNSALYDAALTFQASCTLKVLTVSIFGVAEAVKTITITVAVAPTTTISPSSTTQGTIPFTVTLTTSESGAAIKYKLGTSETIYNYTGPFQVNQNSPGVASTQIKVRYWAVGATATEAEKTIIYNTSSAIPGKPVVTVTNGVNQVKLDWAATANTTSYSIWRSTVAGTKGTALSQYQAANTYTDTTAVAGTTYYYTVDAGNYQTFTPSDQKTGIPTAAPTKPTYRYLRIDGFGEYYSATGYNTSRMIEIEVFSGGVNKMRSPAILNGSTDDAVDTGAEVGSLTPTRITDTVKNITSTAYNIWWSDITLNNNAGNGWVKFDLGSQITIDSIRYWSYSSRSPRFKIWGTNNLADFGANGAVSGGATLIWDASLNNGTLVCGATAGTNNYIEKVY